MIVWCPETQPFLAPFLLAVMASSEIRHSDLVPLGCGGLPEHSMPADSSHIVDVGYTTTLSSLQILAKEDLEAFCMCCRLFKGHSPSPSYALLMSRLRCSCGMPSPYKNVGQAVENAL